MKNIGLIIGPALFFLILAIPNPPQLSAEAWKVIALAAFMLTWWMTEAVALPVTAILPICLIPMLRIEGLDIKAATAPYSNHIVFLFMGGFIIALAMEKWALHRRIALNIVRITGTNADGIILGFLIATASISMWISNTATTIMMLPIALSVVDLLQVDSQGKGMRNFALSLMLGIAYAANIGGTITLIGTPPTVVFSGFMSETYGIEVSFAKWLSVGAPFGIAMIIVTYFVLTKWLFRNGLGKFEGAGAIIQQQLSQLGKMTKGEVYTLIIFSLTAFMWIFGSVIEKLLPWLVITDTTIAMLASVALFITPVNWKDRQFVLDWKDTQKLPWGILLLFGGGLSLANALEKVGLIGLIGDQFRDAQQINIWIILGITTISLFLTEIMSNLALVVVLLPVAGGIATGLGAPPEIICIPVTLAASCAFMLPMSTPPNAIVFASGHLTVAQMARAGMVLNLVSILFIALLIQFVFPLIT